jgi:hypothetical protein
MEATGEDAGAAVVPRADAGAGGGTDAAAFAGARVRLAAFFFGGDFFC